MAAFSACGDMGQRGAVRIDLRSWRLEREKLVSMVYLYKSEIQQDTH